VLGWAPLRSRTFMSWPLPRSGRPERPANALGLWSGEMSGPLALVASRLLALPYPRQCHRRGIHLVREIRDAT
jgi:hypothetical protein